MNPGCLGPDKLAAYEAGDGTPEERAASAAHLLGCGACRSELDWLVSLRGRVEKLPRSIAPGRDLWEGIAPRLGARPAAARRSSRARLILLAAAVVALILAGSAVTALLLRRTAARAPSETATAPSEAAQSAVSLAQIASQVRALELALPPQTRALVAHHLELIDAAIRESEAALAAEPSNPAVRRMLEARYEQRRSLLEQARRATPRS